MRDPGLGERRAQVILLVRAFEEADPEGLILPLRERNKATRRALMVTGLSSDTADSAAAWRIRHDEAIMRRARLLFDLLIRRTPSLERIVRISQLGASTGPVVVGVAFLLGVLTNALGGKQINLLSFPLIGLLGWNLLAYLAMLSWPIVRRGRGVVDLAERIGGYLFRGAVWRRLRSSKVAEGGVSPETRIIGKAVMRFSAMWHRLAGRVLASRVKRILHLGAIATIAGVVVGMYVRGFAFEYRVSWESTWLDTRQMQSLLALVLGPASLVLGLELPDVAPLRGPAGSGDAAPWIHLYAMTALLVVGVPRALMALYQGWNGYRLSRRLPLDVNEPYYRRLFTAWRGATRHVRIVPYSYTPKPGALASLKTLLFDYFGARADLHVSDPLAYGSEASEVTVVRQDDEPAVAKRETCLVLVFNGAQLPENDVHGEFLEELTARLDTRSSRVLVVLDLGPYRSRVADEQRVRERTANWLAVVAAAGLNALPLDLERSVSPAGRAGELTKEGAASDLLGAVHASLWPGPEAVETTG
ncbi:MAG TPA: DUF2868 domain-containing protein [Candidatus Polarisedimenticolaceae bacterium]|nr:DUF2868 domain-containing protein [Candidatus Polarisedimenticolaceae bacterium]